MPPIETHNAVFPVDDYLALAFPYSLQNVLDNIVCLHCHWIAFTGNKVRGNESRSDVRELNIKILHVGELCKSLDVRPVQALGSRV